MLLGSDRDADGGGPSHDEKGTGRSRNAGTKASWPGRPRGRGSEPAIRPGHDHTESGYAPPVRVPQGRLLALLRCSTRAFLRMIYPRSLKSQ
jgi:hypothetical protein